MSIKRRCRTKTTVGMMLFALTLAALLPAHAVFGQAADVSFTITDNTSNQPITVSQTGSTFTAEILFDRTYTVVMQAQSTSSYSLATYDLLFTSSDIAVASYVPSSVVLGSDWSAVNAGDPSDNGNIGVNDLYASTLNIVGVGSPSELFSFEILAGDVSQLNQTATINIPDGGNDNTFNKILNDGLVDNTNPDPINLELTVIPEPASLLLLAAGVAMTLGRRDRRTDG